MITILGPTACGKTSLAVSVARRIGGEIISADSRQVYRRMDIGTGKDLSEYGDVPYHLSTSVSPERNTTFFSINRISMMLTKTSEAGRKFLFFAAVRDYTLRPC